MRDSDKAYESIINMLLSGEIKCGAPVDDKELCQKLNVGKTPLREALMRLVQHGYVNEIPRKGMTFVNLSLTELMSIFNIRIALSEYLGKLLIEKITDNKILKLENLIDEIDEIDEIESNDSNKSCFEIDMKFHNLLIEIANDRYLTEFLVKLQNLSSIALEPLSDELKITSAKLKREFLVVISTLKEKNQENLVGALKKHVPKSVIQYTNKD